MLSSNFYIYRHIRPDTNEVFYIGKGNNLDTRLKLYRRAYLIQQRTDYWKSVVAKNNGIFKVEIIWECEQEKEANLKEIEFISIYGRADLNKGSLVNLTDGGEGVCGIIQRAESIAKRSGKNHYHYQGLMEKYAKEKMGRLEKRKVLDVKTLQVFNTTLEASLFNGISNKNLSRYLNGTKTNKTSLCYYSDYLSGNYKVLQTPKENKGVWRKVIDIQTGLVYDSIRKSITATTYKEPTIRKMLDGRIANKTNLRYADGL